MKIVVVSDPGLGSPARYGVDELVRTSTDAGHDVEQGDSVDAAASGTTVLIGAVVSPLFADVGSDGLAPPGETESYALAMAASSGGTTICVAGSDDKGVMYGCFELAEQIECSDACEDLSDGLTPKRESPDIAVRRLYAFSHNADLERDWYFSEEYWDRYFSVLAKSRFNEFNLIFGHQTAYQIPIYPHLFDMDEYPDVYVDGLHGSAAIFSMTHPRTRVLVP